MRSAGSNGHFLVLIGEFGILDSFGCVLTFLTSSTGSFTLYPTLWTSVHALDPSVRFLQLFGSSGCHVAVSIGKFCIFNWFRHVLMSPASSAAASAFSVTLCAYYVCAFNKFVWPPKLFGLSGALLALWLGKSSGFLFFRGVLMFSGVHVVLTSSVPILGTSLCLIDTSA